MTVFHGEVRILGKDGEPNKVRVTDRIGDSAVEMTEEEYLEHAMRPPLDELPWTGEPRR